MKKVRRYKRIYIHIKDPAPRAYGIRLVPLVLLSDGRPGYDSKLEEYVRALEHLYAFTVARFDNGEILKEQQEGLLAAFIDAKRYGTDELCTTKISHLQYLKNLGLSWEKTSDDSIERAIKAINGFDKWQTKYHGSSPMNPSESRFMTTWEIYQDFRNRAKWDPLLHLHPAREFEKEIYNTEVKPKYHHKRFRNPNSKAKKGFPMGLILKLLDCARNPQDELFLLTMLGGSCRMSEPLHMFRSDIEGLNELGELTIRLADPQEGMVEWTDCNNVVRHGRRKDYFQEAWKNEDLSAGHPLHQLQSRDTYGRRSPLYVGFKGMTFSESDGANVFGYDPSGRAYDVNYLFWLDPRVGCRAYQVYEEYHNQYLVKNYNTGERKPTGWLKHPWLFINISNTKYYGHPLSYSAMQTIWRNLLDRLYEKNGIDLRDRGLGWHSLRHFYGWYCASCLGLDLTTTKAMMHHSSEDSTACYFRISPEVARNRIIEGTLMQLGYKKEDMDLVIFPDTPKLDWPEEWGSNLMKRRMLAMNHQGKLPGRIK
ncbi:MAG: hypothetical protein JRG71_16050 [Deltaproteobacteria bacterium]|nr:hypothetical protein [Deltaproteobacteria bacterium]